MTQQKNSNAVFVTPVGRLMYVSLFSPRPNKLRQGEPRYEATIIFKKNEADLSGLKTIAESTAYTVFGNSIPARPIFPGGPCIKSADKPVFKDGDVMALCKECYAQYAGHWVLPLSAAEKIKIVSLDGQDIIDPSELQSGDYGRAVLEISSYISATWGSQLSIKPKVIQKTAVGEHFSGGISADEAVQELYKAGLVAPQSSNIPAF